MCCLMLVLNQQQQQLIDKQHIMLGPEPASGWSLVSHMA